MITKPLFKLITMIIIGHISNENKFIHANSLSITTVTNTPSSELTTNLVNDNNNSSSNNNDSTNNNYNNNPSALTSSYSSRAAHVGDTFNDSTSTYVLNDSSTHSNDNNDPITTKYQTNDYPSPTNNSQHNYYPSNHQNHYYPSEPYPSASYTSLISSHVPSSSSSSSSQSGNNNHHQQAPSNHQQFPLLNRDHHSSSTIGYPQYQSPFNDNNYNNNSYNDSSSVTNATSSSYASNYFNNSYGSRPSNYNYNHNYDYVGNQTPSSSNSLNIGYIQNLTSALFPAKQISNATLFTLSELLMNRTKQAGVNNQYNNNQQQYNSPSLSASLYGNNNYNGHKSSFTQSNNNNNLHNIRSSQSYFSPSNQPISTSGSSNSNTYQAFDSPVSDPYSIFDYIRPNQFGFREPSSLARYQQQQQHHSSGYYRPPPPPPPPPSSLNSYSQNNRPTYSFSSSGNSNLYNYNHQPSSSQQQPQYPLQGNNNDYHSNAGGYKTSSNIYNTYMPYKDSLNTLPTMTNGQTLAMAIYDNILDNGFRLPSLSAYNNYKSAYQSSISDYNQHPMNYNNNNPSMSSPSSSSGLNNNGYQYIQQHNSNNQNHLDKVVYHSTPFRPSIVSPPSTTTSQYNSYTTPSSGSSSTSSSANSSSGSSEQSSTDQPLPSSTTTGGQQQRPKSTEADNNKSISFASLSSSSSTVSDSKPEYSTNGQSINGNRYSHFKSGSTKQEKSNNSKDNKQTSNGDDLIKDNAESSGKTRNNNNSTNSFNNNNHQNTNSHDNNYDYYNHNSNGEDKRQQHHNKSQSSTINSLTSGSSILLDLYEREIDNQIRESLYRDVVHNPEHLLGLTSRPYQTSVWPTSLYADTDTTPILSDQWLSRVPPVQPATSTSSNPLITSSSQNYHQSILNHNSYLSKLRQPTIATDPLTAALQELPTFSASDLQPIFPSAPAYSLLSSASSQDSYSTSLDPTSSITLALASQLFPQFSQHQLNTLLDSSHDLMTNSGAGVNYNKHHSLTTSNKHKVQYSNTHNQNNQNYHHHNQQSSTNHSPSTSSSYYLPSILFKLHSSPLSSILSNPFVHFYSSGKNREKKKINSNVNHQHHASPSSQYSQFISPTSFLTNPLSGKNVFGLFNSNNNLAHTTNDNLNTSPSSSYFTSTLSPSNSHDNNKNVLENQQAAALAAAATASLIAAATAAADDTFTPLQAALIQAHASNAFNNLATDPTDFNNAPIINSHKHSNHNYQPASSTNSASSYPQTSATSGFGLTGGGLTPMIWRNILSPTLWTRKQSSSGPSNSPSSTTTSSGQINHLSPSSLISPFSILQQPHHNHGSHKWSSANQIGNTKYNHNNQPTSALGSMFGSNTLTSYLFNTSSPQLATAATGSTISSLRKPRLKIKILKIPVAFYDQPTIVGGGGLTAASNSAGLQTTILPAQMQPSSLAAGLLTSIPCQLSHNTPQLPHTLEQHLIRDQASSSFAEAAVALGALLPTTAATITPTKGTAGTSSKATSTTESTEGTITNGQLISSTISSVSPTSLSSLSQTSNNSNSSLESPLSIQGFTDINQPNDLQDSPTILQTKLLKMLQ